MRQVPGVVEAGGAADSDPSLPVLQPQADEQHRAALVVSGQVSDSLLLDFKTIQTATLPSGLAMMQYLLICSVALIASGLTFFSGFGLGTLLLPAFAVFFPVEVAVALTAIVHFLNGVFKLVLVGRHADVGVVVRFGVPAVIAALLGARVP